MVFNIVWRECRAKARSTPEVMGWSQPVGALGVGRPARLLRRLGGFAPRGGGPL